LFKKKTIQVVYCLTRKQVPCRTEKETARKKWVRERVREPSSSRIRRKEQKEANHRIWDPVVSRQERPVQVENKRLESRKLVVVG
jgi:hypothetical protein